MNERGAPRYSHRMVRLFARYLRGYFRRNFDGVRTSRSGASPGPERTPLILYSNHPAWWDPILLLLIGDEYYRGREGYGPIDAGAIERYAFLGRLGLFGVDRDSRRGLRDFLRCADAILAREGAILCVTAEGEFTDPRQRPVTLQPGVAHLMRRHPEVPVVPVALEYPFWNERHPEALIRFGDTLPPDPARASRPVNELKQQLEWALENNMNVLATESMRRDASLFDTIVEGRKGVGGVYDGAKRLKAWFRGDTFDAAHAAAKRADR